MIYWLPFHIPHPTFVLHLSPILMLHYMKCAEQVRNVYGQVQMWKAIYRYIISTIGLLGLRGETQPLKLPANPSP